MTQSTDTLNETEALYTRLIENMGEDANRDGLIKTPKRAAKAMKELTTGYDMNLKSIVNGALYDAQSEDLVMVKDIEFYSLCEHHILPFLGNCHVAYLPGKRIIGLSKIPRIVDMYAKRLQVQEKLTQQIAQAIFDITEAKGVAVFTSGVHMCMRMRGVSKKQASMSTSCLLGTFKTDSMHQQMVLKMLAGSQI